MSPPPPHFEPAERLRRLARGLLFDPGQADDVVQRAWLVALCRREGSGFSLGQLLRGAVKNLARQTTRDEQRRAHRERAAARHEALPSTADTVGRIEVMRLVVDAVEDLPEPYRSAIVLRFFDDLPPRDMAKRLGLPVNTVRTHVRRGLALLRARIDRDGKGDAALLGALLPLAGKIPLPLKLAAPLAATPVAGSAQAIALAMSTKTAAALCSIVILSAATLAVYVGMNDEHTPELAQPPAETQASVPEIVTPPRLEREEDVLLQAATEKVGRSTAVVVADQTVRVSGETWLGSDQLYPQVDVRLRVYDGPEATGEPLHDATVSSDAEGRFTWEFPVPSGTVLLTALEAEEDHFGWAEHRVLTPEDVQPSSLVVRFYPLDSSITGTVRDPQGRPVEGASVSMSGREVFSDAQGHYAIRESSQVSRSYISAKAKGLAWKRQLVQITAPGTVEGIDFDLSREVRIHGLVLDAGGAPIAGAELETFFTHQNTATSGADGRYELGHLDPARPAHSVTARKEGYVLSTVKVETGTSFEAEQDLVLQRGARIAGSVHDTNGKPLSGVEIYIGFSPSAYDRLDAVTDGDGRFVFPAVGSGQQTLVGQCKGYAPERRILQVPEDSTSLPDVDLVLDPGRTIAGQLVDDAGEPVAGVTLSTKHHGEYIEGRVTPDDEGRFLLENVPTDHLGVEVYGTGYVRLSRKIGADEDDITLVIARAGKLAGRVVDGVTGEPLASFRIRFAEPSLQEGDQRLSNYGASWVREGYLFSETEGLWDTGKENLIPGQVAGIEASAPGYAPTIAPRVIVTSAPDPGDLILRLHRGVNLRGRVSVTGTGEPIEGVAVKRYRADERIGGGESDVHGRLQTRTDSEGRFELTGVPPGVMTLTVEHADYSPAREGPIEIAESGDPQPLWIELDPGAKLSGRLLARDRSPLAGETIALSGRSHETPGRRETKTDAEGRFEFAHLIKGKYYVAHNLRRDNVTTEDLGRVVTLQDESPVEIELVPSGSATFLGTIRGKEANILLAVVLLPQGDDVITHMRRGTFTENGRFRVDALEPGPYKIIVSRYDWQGGANYNGSYDFEIGAGESLEGQISVIRTELQND